jgi:hypothetical protein
MQAKQPTSKRPLFQRILRKTNTMVIDKKVIPLHADTLMNKGGILYYPQ